MHARLGQRSVGSACTCGKDGKVSKKNASKLRDKRKTADMKVVSEQAHTERVEHTAWIAQLEGAPHKRKDKLNLSERRNHVAGLRYFMQKDE